jgi:UDP-GlcNAc3NAcA epimerase
MKKILTIVGARPQFVKAAVVSRKFSKIKSVKEVLVHTGQHYDYNMSNVFFRELEMREPDYNLNVGSGFQGEQTGKMIERIEQVLLKEMSNLVIVYGDTNSTLAGALAAKKLNIKIAHIEAGLRSFDMSIPEEVNRVVTDRLSDILFCPNGNSVKNLKKEGISKNVFNYGDIMFDSFLFYREKAIKISTLVNKLRLKDYVLCTIHRAGNTDDIDKLIAIVTALNRINKEIQVIVPLHPRTKKMLEQSNIQIDFKTIDPVGYFDMLCLLDCCSLVITDSGGLQKEAFFSSKHCIVLRDKTEWIELVEHGFSILAGADANKIYKSYQKLISRVSNFKINLFGDGSAGELIVEELIR